ncbi:hypothetical protein EV424DRAFT_1377585 [Suillus variegatus]|nr:hypothetical protein EV424DRAFT_1377585 [Suillus variegatus]
MLLATFSSECVISLLSHLSARAFIWSVQFLILRFLLDVMRPVCGQLSLCHRYYVCGRSPHPTPRIVPSVGGCHALHCAGHMF